MAAYHILNIILLSCLSLSPPITVCQLQGHSEKSSDKDDICIFPSTQTKLCFVDVSEIICELGNKLNQLHPPAGQTGLPVSWSLQFAVREEKLRDAGARGSYFLTSV